MPTALTDRLLRSLKTETSDAGCPGLRAKPTSTGGVSFVLRMRDRAGKPKAITLGSWEPKAPAVEELAHAGAGVPLTLASARRLALEARQSIARGVDPAGEQKALRVAAAAAPEPAPTPVPTLAELIGEYEKVAKQKVWTKRDEAQNRIR